MRKSYVSLNQIIKKNIKLEIKNYKLLNFFFPQMQNLQASQPIFLQKLPKNLLSPIPIRKNYFILCAKSKNLSKSIDSSKNKCQNDCCCFLTKFEKAYRKSFSFVFYSNLYKKL